VCEFLARFLELATPPRTLGLRRSGAGAPTHPVFPITKGLTSRAIADRKTVNVGDVANDPDYLTALATTRSEIIIPVLEDAGERVVGTIDVESAEKERGSNALSFVLRRLVKIM
jgi:putative methionine-R-sulfoxide reductase with GAF domain